MPSDNSQMRDEVSAELNPADSEPADEAPSIPERPAEGASKAKWVEYVTALGMSEDDALNCGRSELIEVADRLNPQGSG